MDMRWHSIFGPGSAGRPDALYVGGAEAARIWQRQDGVWHADLRYPGREAVTRRCTSYEAGRAGVEAWACRHRADLEAHAEHRNLVWLAQQTWRGPDAAAARRRLAELEAAR